MGTDRPFLLACAGLVVAGTALFALGCWLMPVRALKHAWRNR